MKPYSGHCFGIAQFPVLSAWLVCACLLALPNDVRADSLSDLADRAGNPSALQERLEKDRPRGPIFLAIPIAYRFGIEGGGLSTYCSPSVRATNSSNAVIEELVVGIDYLTPAGKPAGTTVARYADIKVRRQETHFFFQLAVSDCKGLEGYVSIVRCVYSTGEDCSSAVQPVGFGTIPLRLKPR